MWWIHTFLAVFLLQMFLMIFIDKHSLYYFSLIYSDNEVPLLPSLDYEKVREDMIDEDTRKRALLLQALRWVSWLHVLSCAFGVIHTWRANYWFFKSRNHSGVFLFLHFPIGKIITSFLQRHFIGAILHVHLVRLFYGWIRYTLFCAVTQACKWVMGAVFKRG